MINTMTSSTFSVLGRGKNLVKKSTITYQNPLYPNQYHTIIVPRIQKILTQNKTDVRVGHHFYQIMSEIAKQNMAIDGLSVVCFDDDGWIGWSDNFADKRYQLAVYQNLVDKQYWLKIRQL